MKFSPAIDIMMTLAANESLAAGFDEIWPEHLLLGILKLAEMDIGPLAQALGDLMQPLLREQHDIILELQQQKIHSTLFRRQLRAALGSGRMSRRLENVLHRSAEAKRVFSMAEAAAQKENHQFVNALHFLHILIDKPTPIVMGLLTKETVMADKEMQTQAQEMTPKEKISKGPPALGELTSTLHNLRQWLRAKIFGQDHAIQAFIEGIFSAEITADADTERRRPQALFLFAGPPGVGKTFLAELAAQALKKPFKRFDMSSYADHQSAITLVGAHKSFMGAHPGQLTDFVAHNPTAVLLFDEVEKAHLNVIQIFLQLLDAGILEDKFAEQNVNFRDTTIIFTTNTGKSIYDRPNMSGINTVNSNFLRQTILSALEKETDPRTGQPAFPQSICSRLATGYPVMFNRLSVHELELLIKTEFFRQGELIAKQHKLQVEFDPNIPICLILREGASSDARTVKSQAEAFAKSEMFKFCNLFKADRLDKIFKEAGKITFELDADRQLPEDINDLLQPSEAPTILLIADESLATLWQKEISAIKWKIARDLSGVLASLESDEIDMVLLDLWLGREEVPVITAFPPTLTMQQFDRIPAAASDLAKGQEILRSLHEKHPEVPCYLLSLTGAGPGVDEELFLACVRSGGARGVIETSFVFSNESDWQAQRDNLVAGLQDHCIRLWRERKARALSSEHKALMFDTVPQVAEKLIRIRLRNLRFVRALVSEDISEVMDEVERPQIRFSDVFGADAAKNELHYIVDWLRDPRQFRMMGLRPPRGILLYGHPGTGKTFLARALAGESKTAFLVASAANFITIWQGSGQQNIRNLFDRARRYAPAIVFIDEIDAIGKRRHGGSGAGEAAEQALNALMTEMDGFATPMQRPVIVIAATNLLERLDEALRRRFDREIEVEKPDKAGRRAYLTKRLQGNALRQVSNTIIDRLAGQSMDMTIADLERVIELAGRTAVSKDGVISDPLIEEAFECMRLGEARATAGPETLKRLARHEAGHCMITWLNGEKPVQVTIMARGRAGGFMEKESEERRMLFTKVELENMIAQVMGGRAAEIYFYGADDGLSTGASEDLRTATRYAESMVCSYGMDNTIGQIVVQAERLDRTNLSAEILRAAEKIIHQQLDRAVTLLKNHKKTLDQLVNQLLDKNRLTGEDLEIIFKNLEREKSK